MSDEPEPLEPDIAALLGMAKAEVPVDAAARARVLAGVEARILALPSGGGGDRGGGDHGGGGGDAKFGQPNSGNAGASGLGKILASRPIASLFVALAVGAAAGALGRGASESRVVYIDRVVPAAAASTAPTSESTAPPIAAETKAPLDGNRDGSASRPVEADARSNASAVARSSAAPLDSGAALAAESALLDIARTALARGEPDHALAAVGRHASQFPHGLLAEEREALAVKALAQAGRGADAKSRADRFRARYPESLFSTAIDSSLQDVHQMDPKASRQP